jgi:hypothetical protein
MESATSWLSPIFGKLPQSQNRFRLLRSQIELLTVHLDPFAVLIAQHFQPFADFVISVNLDCHGSLEFRIPPLVQNANSRSNAWMTSGRIEMGASPDLHHWN